MQGRIQEGAHSAHATSKIGKNMISLRKIVIFHTNYPKIFRASLRSAQFFYVRSPLTWNPGSPEESVEIVTCRRVGKV